MSMYMYKKAASMSTLVLLAGLAFGVAVSVPSNTGAFWGLDTDTPTPIPSVQSNGAAFVNQVVIATLAPGQTTSVSITMKNTGTTTWIGGDYGYKLGSQNPQDNTRWGFGRMYLQDVDVKPGKQTTFTYDITAPLAPGDYNFQWQMVSDDQNNGGWFGALTDNIVIKVINIHTPTPTPTPTPTATPLATRDVICPLNSTDFTKIFYFSDPINNYIIANTTENGATSDKFPFTLAAGIYNTTLVGYDNHFDHPDQYQPNEQYLVRLFSGSAYVTRTYSLYDILDDREYQTTSYANLRIGQPITSLMAVHSAYPNSNPNSITPVCVGFKLTGSLETPTPTLTPTPTINPFCSATISKATISWNSAERGAQEYYVDVDNDNNWSNGFWNKFVASGNTSTAAQDGFSGVGTGTALTLVANATYYVRVFYVATNEHSPTASFSASNCGTPGNAKLSIDKLVRNITQNSGETDSVSARPFDTVEFVIRVRNTGTANAVNVRIWDVLPAGLTYQSGDALNTNVGTLTPDQQTTLRFRATVREDAYFSYGTTPLTNTATALADNTDSVNASAKVWVTRNQQYDTLQ